MVARDAFEIRGDQFLKNGSPFKIISGSIHYFRVVPEYWKDRLEKLRAMGCNTVETYVPWNLHEPRKGHFDFSGRLDLARFLETAASLGLNAIVRPSPYICAEHEFGGLPAWLLSDDGMRVRSSSGPFLSHVKSYYRKLFRTLAPLQASRGGPIILFQTENEYGSYGNDTAYLQALFGMMVENGMEMPCITSDGPWNGYLDNGALPGNLPTVNFGSKADAQLDVLASFMKRRGIGGPLMVTEFWVGWFDSWGDEKHHTTDAEGQAADLDAALARGSINIYMFHGGTSFGFTNGANNYDKLAPDVTSYDYDSPLSEDGRVTEKYLAFRNVIARHAPVPELRFSQQIERTGYGEIECSGKVSLFSALDDIASPVSAPQPVCMEKLGQDYGYTLYRANLENDSRISTMRLYEANDRAQVFIDGIHRATWYDRELLENHECDWDCAPAPKEGGLAPKAGGPARLDILVESMGRVNYGPLLDRQRKGINGPVWVNSHGVNGWAHYALPLTNVGSIDFEKGYEPGVPAFYRFRFIAEKRGDTFLDMKGWGKGCAIVNGFNVGRFWSVGPQRRLYVPAPLLREGKNEVIIFETEGLANEGIAKHSIRFEKEPDLG